ncbi:hypothetical protein LTR36_007203 [Oleoguttula mirabilis]|uniref:Uncharacterized protein n=1 Tax=Oleoguttula mirabilis TaxID=1507867 RepID=A0AAV9JAV4_9PEZI|nr:hypothetical protein LTR36_007203 [Oleoguttula mirabilis]
MRRARAKKATPFDLETAIARRLAGDRDFIYKLTNGQREAIIDGITDRNQRLESRIDELEQEVTSANSERDQAVAEAARKRSLQQAAALERIHRKMEQRRASAASQARQATDKEPERPTSPTPSEPPTPSRSEPQREQESARMDTASPPKIATPANAEPQQQQEQNQQRQPARRNNTTPPATSTPTSSEPQQEQALTITTTSATPPAPASSSTVPAWRKLITNAAGFLSPFGRRAPPPPHRSTPQIGDRKRPAPGDEGEHTPKRARTEEQPQRARIAEPAVTADQETPSQKRITAAVPQSAPAAQKQASTSLGELTPATRKRSAPSGGSTPKPAKTPHLFVGPSSKNPKVPTSLSTITEYSDNSRLSMLPDSTPAPMSTPSRMPNKRRSIAEVRASRLSGLGTPRGQPYSWERSSTSTYTPRPALLNADMRFEKLERMKKLTRELEELKQDQDVIEMESHRRKKVKVDNLVYIPHNRPGDSAGTFRVPDIDSDDEMEVDMSVPERSNVFEDASRNEQHLEREQEYVREEHVLEEAPQAVSQWNFPSVGKRAANDVCLAEESERCRIVFATGFEAWKLELGY